MKAVRHWVFAYGSNMDLDDLRRWCRERRREPLEVFESVVAALPGHTLVWNYYSEVRRGAAANVGAGGDRPLPGLLLQVDATGLSALDAKEGHPERYRRELQPVTTANAGAFDAWVYAVRPEYLRREPVRPTAAYLRIMISAAERHAFPQWYLNELRSLSRG